MGRPPAWPGRWEPLCFAAVAGDGAREVDKGGKWAPPLLAQQPVSA
jgi:hypothetical protein